MKDKKTFGEETLNLFRTHYREDDLTSEEIEFLADLRRDSVRPGEAHDDFFHRHREKLRADPRLFKRWERLVFRKPIETDDLAEGLLRLAFRAKQEADEVQDPRLYVRLRKADTPVFWRDMNTGLCRLLRDRWRGLDRLLAPEVKLDLGLCWDRQWENDLRDAKGRPTENERASKETTHFEFEAFLVPAAECGMDGKPSDAALRKAPRAQMTWRPAATSMETAFPLDLAMVAPRVGNPPPARCEDCREPLRSAWVRPDSGSCGVSHGLRRIRGQRRPYGAPRSAGVPSRPPVLRGHRRVEGRMHHHS
ncbi:hypothetical protein [Azospirillum argentinense]|uniref:hypothetical protein n=1 Tax=Azospirillum argentinense TaxID=2970906 RepID=UPI001586C9EE|nr:hypothetical protein [Azospirillum argentinense]